MTARWTFGALLAAALALAVPAQLSALCRNDCTAIKAKVLQQARVDYRSCRLACRTAASPRDCRRGCAVGLTDTRQDARATLQVCRQSCQAASSCDQQCLAPFYACAEPIAGSAFHCADTCATGARAAAETCLSAPYPAACWAQVALQTGTCGATCKDTASAATDACQTTFGTCLQGCPASGCEDGCMESAHGCLRRVARDVATCGADCVATGFQTGARCVGQSDPRGCFTDTELQFEWCAQGCLGSERAGVRACGSETSGCLDQCQPPPGCRDECVVSGKECLDGVTGGLKLCGAACATSLSPDVMACIGQADLLGCLLPLAAEAQTCADTCKSTAYDAGAVCRSGFEGCVGACPADSCLDGCAGSLETCVGALFGTADACATGCVNASYGNAFLCLFQADPNPCFVAVGVRLGACALGCENTARNTGDECKGTFVSCESSCVAASDS